MGDITSFRVLVQPHVQAKAIADLVAAIAAADVDGINIDFEPPNPKHPDGSLNPESPLAATIQDGTVPCTIDLSRTRFCSLPFTPNS